jgi:hypothetical protein
MTPQELLASEREQISERHAWPLAGSTVVTTDRAVRPRRGDTDAHSPRPASLDEEQLAAR